MHGIGIDIVEFQRIRQIKEIEKFVERILSEDEKKVYNSQKNENRKIEYLAGRFAAKEAIYKAMPDQSTAKGFINYSVLNDERGVPYVTGPFQEKIMITISHSENYVVAFVVIL